MNSKEYEEFRKAIVILGFDTVSQFLRACARDAIKKAVSVTSDQHR